MHKPGVTITALSIVLFALVGCGSQTTTQQTTAATSTSASDGSKFTGTAAGDYTLAYQLCSAFSPRKIARDYGKDDPNPGFHAKNPSPTDVAQALADEYTPEYRQAVSEGCLDGFLKQPAQVSP